MTTVGYGDFGADNSAELIITILWMALGSAFYAIQVGSLTSVMIEQNSKEDQTINKLKALQKFFEDQKLKSQLDLDNNKKTVEEFFEEDRERQVLEENIRQFVYNNQKDLFSRMDEDMIVKEIPATLKEEVLFHQFGNLMFKFSFFEKIGNNDFVWSML